MTQTLSCPKGGTVAVTGTTQNCPPDGGSGTESIDLSYAMTVSTSVTTVA